MTADHQKIYVQPGVWLILINVSATCCRNWKVQVDKHIYNYKNPLESSYKGY